MDFLAVLGGFASALAIATALTAVWRWVRRRRQRHRLEDMTQRLQALADEVKTVAVEIDHRHSAGVEWAGIAIWPEALAPLIDALDRLIDESDLLTARARGIAADAATERLRADVERSAAVLRAAADAYRRGAIANYQNHMGKPIPPGATGRDFSAALTPDGAGEVDQLRKSFTLLIRTCLYQLGRDGDAREYEASWPIRRWEVFELDPHWAPPATQPGEDVAPPIGDGY
jgi:uncharacterized membrane protein YccC